MMVYMKKPSAKAITGQYIVTSMSMGWDSENPVADPCIFTTMSIEYTHDPLPPADAVAPDAGAAPSTHP
jgi:hypothetical protein